MTLYKELIKDLYIDKQTKYSYGNMYEYRVLTLMYYNVSTPYILLRDYTNLRHGEIIDKNFKK